MNRIGTIESIYVMLSRQHGVQIVLIYADGKQATALKQEKKQKQKAKRSWIRFRRSTRKTRLMLIIEQYVTELVKIES